VATQTTPPDPILVELAKSYPDQVAAYLEHHDDPRVRELQAAHRAATSGVIVEDGVKSVEDRARPTATAAQNELVSYLANVTAAMLGKEPWQMTPADRAFFNARNDLANPDGTLIEGLIIAAVFVAAAVGGAALLQYAAAGILIPEGAAGAAGAAEVAADVGAFYGIEAAGAAGAAEAGAAGAAGAVAGGGVTAAEVAGAAGAMGTAGELIDKAEEVIDAAEDVAEVIDDAAEVVDAVDGGSSSSGSSGSSAASAASSAARVGLPLRE
jgi:hypothetical protein